MAMFYTLQLFQNRRECTNTTQRVFVGGVNGCFSNIGWSRSFWEFSVVRAHVNIIMLVYKLSTCSLIAKMNQILNDTFCFRWDKIMRWRKQTKAGSTGFVLHKGEKGASLQTIETAGLMYNCRGQAGLFHLLDSGSSSTASICLTA